MPTPWTSIFLAWFLARAVPCQYQQGKAPAHHTLPPSPCMCEILHKCMVTVYEGGHQYQFMVFFNQDISLPESQSLCTLLQGHSAVLKGDAFVMQLGIWAHYINMCDYDTILVDWLMRVSNTLVF